MSVLVLRNAQDRQTRLAFYLKTIAWIVDTDFSHDF